MDTATFIQMKRYTPSQSGFWRITISLSAASLFTFSDLYSVQPLLPLFSIQFHLSPVKSSYLLTSTVLMMIIGLLVLGFLSDRMGRVRIMTFGLIGSFSTLFFIPMSHSFEMLLAIRAINGFFLAGVPAAAIAYISEEISRKYIGYAVSLYIAGNALGGMEGRVLVGYIGDLYGWRTAFYALNAVSFFTVVIFFVFLPRSKYFLPNRSTLLQDVQGMIIHVKNKSLLPYFSTGVLLQIVFTGVWTYLPFYLQKAPFSLDLKTMSMSYFIYALGVLGTFVAGKISTKISIRIVMIGGFIFILAGVGLTIFPSIIAVIIGLSLLTTGFFITHSMAAIMVSRKAKHQKGGASSFYLVCYYVGVVAGGTLVGMVWVTYHWKGIASLSILLLPILLYLIFSKQEQPV